MNWKNIMLVYFSNRWYQSCSFVGVLIIWPYTNCWTVVSKIIRTLLLLTANGESPLAQVTGAMHSIVQLSRHSSCSSVNSCGSTARPWAGGRISPSFFLLHLLSTWPDFLDRVLGLKALLWRSVLILKYYYALAGELYFHLINGFKFYFMLHVCQV